MNRRSFLKAIGVTAGVIAVPEFKLIIPEAIIPQGLEWFASVREIADYDLSRDQYMVRHDVLGQNIQLQITQILNYQQAQDAEYVEYIRKIAARVLRREMTSLGITLAELRPLETPPGVGLTLPLVRHT